MKRKQLQVGGNGENRDEHGRVQKEVLLWETEENLLTNVWVLG